VKQLAEEFGLSYARVNHLIRQYDGDVEQIALSREKSKKTAETEKAPKTDKTDENTDISVDKKESKSLELDLKDKVSFEGIDIEPSTTSLKLKNSNKLTEINALASLINLNDLTLERCENLTDISALASLKNLKTLSLYNCTKLKDISGLATLVNLKKLDLRYCSKIKDFNVIKSLTKTEIDFE